MVCFDVGHWTARLWRLVVVMVENVEVDEVKVIKGKLRNQRVCVLCLDCRSELGESNEFILFGCLRVGESFD